MRYVLISIITNVPVYALFLLVGSRRRGNAYLTGYRDGWDVCDQNWAAGGVQRPSPLSVPSYDTLGRNPDIFPTPRQRDVS